MTPARPEVSAIDGSLGSRCVMLPRASQIRFFFIEYLWIEVNAPRVVPIDFHLCEVEMKQSRTFNPVCNVRY